MKNERFKLKNDGKSITFSYEGRVSHKKVWERCLDLLKKESAYAKSGKLIAKNIDVGFSKPVIKENKELGYATYSYQQYVVHDRVFFPVVGAVISFLEEEEGLVRGSSHLVPEFAALDFPSKELFESNDDIEVVKVKGEDPEAFWLSFAVPNYNRELKTSWLDLEGNPLRDVVGNNRDTYGKNSLPKEQ